MHDLTELIKLVVAVAISLLAMFGFISFDQHKKIGFATILLSFIGYLVVAFYIYVVV